jgi:hypothetical protein
MRLRDAIIWFVCGIAAISLFVIAGRQLDSINSSREQMKLISNKPLENAPPSLAFATVAMGAFRGLVVDVLWLRADKLKNEGQFFDAKQLAEWITVLQPRFASVWEFQAWNMAYNISSAIPETQPEERWRWVRNGYELLRDKGIPLNPNNIQLYRELSRIFQHKLGSVSDNVHKYYKLRLAMAMEPLLGSADSEYFKALAEAPADWRQIAGDSNIVPLITALKSADRAFANDEHFVDNYLSLRQNPARFSPDAFKVIDSFRGTKTLEKFDIFAKACQLRNVWKLDPVLMQELNNTYGPVEPEDPNKHLPLDWRHPETHAIYWAVKGLRMAGKKEFSIEEARTDRFVGFGLQNLFYGGKIFIWNRPAENTQNPYTHESLELSREIFLRPDLRMFEPCNRQRLKVLQKYSDNEQHAGTYETMQNGHRNMLKNAVLLFYQAGHIQHAQKIYNQLRELYPRDEFKPPLADFARNCLLEDFSRFSIHEATQSIQMLLQESYFRYAVRDDDEAFGREKLAKEAYDYYNSKYSDETLRVNLPEFSLMRYFGLLDFLNDPEYPQDLRRSLLGRIRLERPELAEQLRQQEEKVLRQQAEQSR